MVGLRSSLGRVAILAAVAYTLVIFTKDVLKLVSPETSERPPISDVSGVCAALQRELQQNKDGLTGQAKKDWEKFECSRRVDTTIEKLTLGAMNLTAELDVALRKEMDRQRPKGGTRASIGEGGADASGTPKAAPASKGSGAPGNSPGAWMDGLKRQVQKELGRGSADTKNSVSSGTSVPKTGIRPEKTHYVSPFSTEAERNRNEQLLSSLGKELKRQKQESENKKANVPEGARNVTSSPRTSSPSKPQPTHSKTESPTSSPSGVTEVVKRCRDMKEMHKVLVGYSWGNLSVAGQKVWKNLGCDAVFLTEVKIDAKSDEDWCKHVVKRYKVVPLKTWGQLPFDLTDTWRAKACDSFFIAQKKTSRIEKDCSNFRKPPWMSSIPVVKAGTNPLVVIMAASTTRKIRHPSTKSLALCNYLLTSIVRTVECGFRYAYVLGYDQGDPFFDDPLKMKVWVEFVSHLQYILFVHINRRSLRNGFESMSLSRCQR